MTTQLKKLKFQKILLYTSFTSALLVDSLHFDSFRLLLFLLGFDIVSLSLAGSLPVVFLFAICFLFGPVMPSLGSS